MEDPEAKVRMRVESPEFETPCSPKLIFTRSKWCLDPTKSLTKLLVELEEKDRPYSERDKYSVSSFGSNSDCFEMPIVPHSAIILQAPPVGIISIRRSESNKSVRFDPETIY